MGYTVHVQCVRCGRKYSYRSDLGPLVGDCPLCWRTPDLTEAEAALEDEGKDDA